MKENKLGALLAPLDASLVQPVTSSVAKGISGRGVIKARRKAGVFSRNNLPKTKDGVNLVTLYDKKVKEHIGFHSLFIDRNTAIQLYTLILL